MINWQFNAEDYEERSFELIPIGDYRFRIEDAEETKSSKGNDMIKVTLAVSGKNSKIFHNINFMPDNPKLTNQLLGEFWDSFGIAHGNLNVATWKGKVGAGRVKHDTYNGDTMAKVSYFKSPKQAEKLPPWVEPSSVYTQPVPTPTDADVPFNRDDIPL